MGSTTLVKRLQPDWQTNFGNLAAGASETLTLASHVDCGGFQEVDVCFRLHSAFDLGSASASVAFTVQADGYAFDDPSTSFLTFIGDGGGTVGPISGPLSGAQYYLVIVGNSGNPFGRYLNISMTVTQGTPKTSILIDLSVELVMKGGAPATPSRAPNSLRGFQGQ